MSESNGQVGSFVWFDLMTKDIAGAMDFYTKLVGWTTQRFGDGEPRYDMFMVSPEEAMGGLMTLPEEAAATGAPPHWIGFAHVADCAASAAKVGALGGQVMRAPWEIPNVGSCAIVADPQGAVFALFQPLSGSSSGSREAGMGEVSWSELATADQGAAWSFYEGVLGWEKAATMDMGPMGTYLMWRAAGGERSLGGIFDKPAEVPMSFWLHYIRVPDVDAAAEQVKALGGQIVNGPMEVAGGDRVVQCCDPQGAMFALHAVVQA